MMNLREIQPYVIGWIRDYLTQALAGALSVFRLVVHELTVTRIHGDLATVPWTNYGPISTIVGWSSFYTCHLYYKKLGRLMLFEFFLYGVSNSPAVTFTIPYNAVAAPAVVQFFARTHDGDGTETISFGTISGGTNTVIVYKNASGAGFISSGDKSVSGQFFVEVEA